MATLPDHPFASHQAENGKAIDAKAIVLFCVVTFVLGFSISSPLWANGQGLSHPSARTLLTVMTFAPAVGLLAVRFLLPKSVFPLTATTGLGFGRWPQSLGYYLFGWFGLTIIGLATPFVGTLFGMFRLDLANFSGYHHLILQRPDGQQALAKFSIQTLALIQLETLLIAPGLSGLFAFCEEWGWRGFLLPKLLPLGQWKALLLTGTFSGLWYSPVVLLGYDYALHPRFGVLLMTIYCVIFGILFGWLRLATGSVWPAVFGHGAINAVGGFPYVIAAADQTIDTAHLTILGWTGWILPLLVIFLLVVLKRIPVANPKC